jgi:hypothetical protein
MRIGIMQPYLFPYIGYFQLINSVDVLVIYEDVNYIKQGWINRNRILLNNQPVYFTIELKGASSFKKINEIEVNFNADKLLKTLYQAYSKAPFFGKIYPLIEKILKFETNSLSKLVTYSLVEVCNYLGINTEFEISSKYRIRSELRGEERVIEICKYFKADEYINPIGGTSLYNKSAFNSKEIELNFLKSSEITYKQFNNGFVPWLSIIDVMMFNPREEISKMLDQYELI